MVQDRYIVTTVLQCLQCFHAIGWWQDGYQPVKDECSYIGHGDLTGALHIWDFLLSPLPSSSSLAKAKSSMVWHFGTDLPRLSLSQAMKRNVVVSYTSLTVNCIICIKCLLYILYLGTERYLSSDYHGQLRHCEERVQDHTASILNPSNVIVMGKYKLSCDYWHIGATT